MARKIYKYFSGGMLDLIFQREGFCGIKCSYPKDYNDPYELFLGVDLNVGPEVLATYREIIYELPQYPTTCFSRSPIVAPMWAHYAQNHSGFVVEFDAECLSKAFDGVAIRDVNYREEPADDIAANLQRAAVTKKPRHAVWLQQAVLYHAYFSKYTMWSYEQECRLVDDGGHVENIGGNNILFVPEDCISSLIVGSKFPKENVEYSKKLANNHEINWFRANIGKSLALPFFTDESGDAFVFSGEEIVEAQAICDACAEPFEGEGERCPWCSITEDHELEAALGNPLRVLDRIGGLEDYFESVRRIQESTRKKR